MRKILLGPMFYFRKYEADLLSMALQTKAGPRELLF